MLSRIQRSAWTGVIVVAAFAAAPQAHDVTTRVTWNREVSRIVHARCATCHRPGGSAFSLLSYQEASPWANAIRDAALQRTMPPWGVVKGFGNFRNDRALTQEELDLIANWANGGAPEGNPNDLPSRPRILQPPSIGHRPGEIVVSGTYTFQRPFTLDGFWAPDQPKDRSVQVTIALPDGRIEPLVWFHDYTAQSDHPFLLRRPLAVPTGAVLRGLPAGSSLVLVPDASNH
jgi:mono/diheme cytochrome c family protein